MNENKTPVKAFSKRYNGIPSVLNVNISISSTMSKSNKRSLNCVGIWDTGATCSAISSDVVKQCGLVPIGKATVHTAGGQVSQNVYLVDIKLPNNVVVKSVKVTEIPQINGADALIGMDIMSLGDMALTHYNGKTIFTFRIPSVENIDFVKIIAEQNEKALKKLERQQELLLRKRGNEKCPCGSGRKYRYCCGKKKVEVNS